MVKDIKYKGIKLNTTVYSSSLGELSESLGMEYRDGALAPSILHEVINTIPNGYTLIHIHSGNGYKNYIFLHTNKKLYFTKTLNSFSFTEISTPDNTTEINSVTHIGNTLIVLVNKVPFYYLLKDNSYSFLGDAVPFPDIVFTQSLTQKNLESKFWDGGLATLLPDPIETGLTETIDNIEYTYNKYQYKDLESGKYLKSELDRQNDFLSKNIKPNDDDYIFTSPFYIRYAVKLYNGEYTLHSSPIYISIPKPQSYINVKDTQIGYWGRLEMWIAIISLKLNSKINPIWADIIQSVDIFISDPIRLYDTVNLITEFKGLWKKDNSNVYGQNMPLGIFEKDYEENIHPDNFYRIMSIPFADVCKVGKTMQNGVMVDKLYSGNLSYKLYSSWDNLLTKPTLSVEYGVHHKVSAERAMAYNAKLHLFKCQKRYFDGFKLSNSLPRISSYYSNSTNYNIQVYVYIKSEAYTSIVLTENNYTLLDQLKYFYYPDPNAYKVRFKGTINSDDIDCEFALSRHPYLNGAYLCNKDLSPIVFSLNTLETITEVNNYFDISNKLYTSSINNPFYFEADGIYTFSSNVILGIASATKALSTGQFGQFPLYVFTDDGITALDVNATGDYTTKQPLSRIVCNNEKSITPIDNGVIFTSDNGIMLISGSDIKPISDDIYSQLYSTPFLPGIDMVLSQSGISINQDILNKSFNISNNTVIAYDYKNSRLICSNPDIEYSFVYNINSASWSKITSSFVSVVNNYPDSICITSGNKAINYSANIQDSTIINNGIIITRPIKLENDTLSTVYRMIQRGCFDDSCNKTKGVNHVLYGSRDGINFTALKSSISSIINNTGSPYKYYIIVVIAKFKTTESISGVSIDYQNKQTNKLR